MADKLFDRRGFLFGAGTAAISLAPPRLIGGAATVLGLAASPAHAEEPRRGGVMNIILQPEPATLVLALNITSQNQLVASKIYSGLLTYGFDLKPLPNLATSWEISPDGLTYTFHLAKNAKWHDGEPFTADDVIFTTREMLPEVHARARVNFSPVASAEAPDPHTAIFHLKTPYPGFICAFETSSAPMMPKHIYAGTDYRNNPANEHPIGTGPFRFKEWQRGSIIRMERNPDYFKPGLPYLDGINFVVIPDGAQRLIALESGQVHLASSSDIEFNDLARLRSLPQIQVETRGYEFLAPLSWLEMNNTRKPMDDKRFRQAVMHALDRDFIRDKIFYGFARVPTGPIHSAVSFYDGNVKRYPFDRKKAEALLDEMGLKRGADGMRVKLELNPAPVSQTWMRLVQYTKQALRQVGIDVTIRNMDQASSVASMGNHDFDMCFVTNTAFGDPAVGVARSYITSNIRKGVPFTNTCQYSNPRVDQLFDAAAKSNDRNERQRLYTEVQQILAEDVPVAWLLEMEYASSLNRQMRDVITTGLGVSESFDRAWITG
jgi:peptide/nickel transport system substrate-binding protein